MCLCLKFMELERGYEKHVHVDKLEFGSKICCRISIPKPKLHIGRIVYVYFDLSFAGFFCLSLPRDFIRMIWLSLACGLWILDIVVVGLEF